MSANPVSYETRVAARRGSELCDCLTDAARDHLSAFAERLLNDPEGLGTRVPSGNLHVTLKFLGQVNESEAPDVCDALRGVQATVPMLLFAEHLELLPERGPVRIISAGLGGELDKIHLLHQRVEEACEPLGFARERRRYRPHVTLIRLRKFWPPSDRLGLVNASMRHFPGPVFSVGEFVLIQSHLHQNGAQYIPVARFPLKQDT